MTQHGDWSEVRYDQLRADADALAERIRALSGILEGTPEPTQQRILRDQLAVLNKQWEDTVARRDRIREGMPPDVQGSHASDTHPIEHRVTTLEREIKRVWGVIRPGPRQMLARVLFYGLIFGMWSMWMIKEVRDWLIVHPAQAIAITLAVLIAALIIRWLPEEDHHD